MVSHVIAGLEPVSTVARRPRRAVDRDSQFFAEGLTRGLILIQRCGGCGRLRHPPQPICSHCRSFEWDTVEASGRGSIYTFAVHHAPPLPGFSIPFVIVLVELEEGVRMIGDLVGNSTDAALKIGAPVTAAIMADEGDNMLLVRWRLDGATA
ncbi:Zn-ribbon domain-containing OB-fold protein [Sphingomonas sp.]|uniref:Zn-ribbon domain-containing OB-fold protein n=1 Tax=Sphingomonas sp. TaxID=28214 RepID=UPI003B005755